MVCIPVYGPSARKITHHKTGRVRVKRAAALRNDSVPNRIKRLDDKTDDHNGMFSYYNTNKCYTSCTHSGKLKAIEENI
ncbi:hypothetical protein DPMN_185558 [Dreissena polymorpha]|uniref:Uncharacterized protein n=1 Tax=Dreissena polymorpha TaxID=45954 RepID=A0A9D4I8U1_DREPO|nr:hypothetical protein DPMN_185558 [Dreissena polymorpha]